MNLCDVARRTGLTRQRVLQIARRKKIGEYAERHWSFTEADYQRIQSGHDAWVAAILKREENHADAAS